MKKLIFCIPLLLVLLGCNQTPQSAIQVEKSDAPQVKTAKTIDQLIEQLQDPDDEQVMVIAHRGDWRNAPENSIQAIKNSIEMGVDMIEIDIRKSKDGQLVLMHDDTIGRTTNGKGRVSDFTLDSLRTFKLKNGLGRWTDHQIPTLEEAMLVAKGKILINLDKCYDYFAEAYEILEKTGTVNHVVMKAKLPYEQVKKEFGEYLDKVFFMPIVDLNEPEQVAWISTYQEQLKPVAFEFIFREEIENLSQVMDEIQQKGSKTWINPIYPELCAGHDDDRAITDLSGSYDWILARNFNMWQTDRPALLIDYLEAKELH